jgi:hypothetical protein
MNQFERVTALHTERRPRRHAGGDDVIGLQGFRRRAVPTRIVQTQGGHPTLDLTITAVQPNVFVDITVPQIRFGLLLPPADGDRNVTKVADGLFWITGGSHHTPCRRHGRSHRRHRRATERSAVEVVLAESEEGDPEQADTVRRYNTHVHFDHSGGLRTFVDEAHGRHAPGQVAYYEKAWAAPSESDCRSAREVEQEGHVPGGDRSCWS